MRSATKLRPDAIAAGASICGQLRTPPATGEHATRDALRAATRAPHLRLHAHPGLAALAEGQLDRAGYCRLLLDLLPLHLLVERRLAMFADSPVFGWRGSYGADLGSERLRADMRCLGAAPVDIPDLGRLLPPFGSAEAALGCAWVIEGSALGARILSASLAASLGIGPGDGGAFFAPRSESKANWLACCAAIEAAGLAPGRRAGMVAAAQATFDAFLQWLDGTA